VTEPFVDKTTSGADRSNGRIRVDVVHDKLEAMGCPGWIAEPGLWLQWDYAAGPMLAGKRVVFFVAWLAWSRFRVVVPLRNHHPVPSVIARPRGNVPPLGWCADVRAHGQ
jgi:hypothetical protein